jgi:exodeoxyribonuclease VII large subunit
MGVVFLDVPFAQKEAAKALGARFDWASKRWFVPPGLALAAFSRWLAEPASAASAAMGPESEVVAVASAPVSSASESAGAVAAIPAGRALSSLMAEITGVVSTRFSETVWVQADVLPFEPRRGHLYCELVETDANGREVARARATVWNDDRDAVIGRFEKLTGIQFLGGIKVLVRVTVSFHARFGLSLAIREMSADFTLGELALRRRRIREQLVREGLYGNNRALALPSDFMRILVIAPEGAAGLGDFRAEADLLERLGICQFFYRTAVFQGPQASLSLSAALSAASADAGALGVQAIALIRGGGASADLHWLDDLEIARAVCLASVPVLIGIGHERDQTLLDELARWVAGTPSKLIQFIQTAITDAAMQAQRAFDATLVLVERALERVGFALDQGRRTVIESARAQWRLAEQQLAALDEGLASEARAALERQGNHLERQRSGVVGAAETLVRLAARDLDLLQQRLLPEATRRVGALSSEVSSLQNAIARAARQQWDLADATVPRELAQAIGFARQRPFQRGFALVQTAGRAVPSAAALPPVHSPNPLTLRFRDGSAEVVLRAAPRVDPVSAAIFLETEPHGESI